MIAATLEAPAMSADDDVTSITAALGRKLHTEVEDAAASLLAAVEIVKKVGDQIPSALAVNALCETKGVTKSMKVIDDLLKELLKMRHQPKDAEGKPLNESVEISGDDGSCIELRASRKANFVPERAAGLLKEKGLYNEVLEHRVVVTDPKALAKIVNEVRDRLVALGDADLSARLRHTMITATTAEATLSEDNIGALTQLGKLTIEEAERMFDIVVSHSAYDVTKKK